MAPAAAVPWSQLPKEIWAAIGKLLDSQMDVLRFRSVCTTWRFLIPISLPSAPRLPLSVPVLDRHPIAVVQSTVYSLHPSLDDPLSPPSSSPGWLIKIAPQSAAEESDPESGSTMQLLNPLTDRKINFNSGITFPNPLNLLNLRVSEICKEYKVQHAKVKKVLVSPNSPWTNVEDIFIVGIFKKRLILWKYGRESWTVIKDERLLPIDDIIHYRGQFYAVDKLGTVLWIDSAMRVVQFSPPMCGGGDLKHLVECNGDLYVVDQYFEVPASGQARDFKVYKLNQEWGKWEEVRSLGDKIIFLGLNCSFSVSVDHFAGCPANSIYYVKDPRFRKPYTQTRVFNMGDQTIERMAYDPEYLQIVWPPPAWLTLTPPEPELDIV